MNETYTPSAEEIAAFQQRAAMNFSDNSAFDDISLQEKTVEPHRDENWASYINRNWQLGNLTRREFQESMENVAIASKYFSVPAEFGGLDFVHNVGHNIMKRVNTFIVASNSIEGFGRRTLITKMLEFKGGAPKKGSWIKGRKD